MVYKIPYKDIEYFSKLVLDLIDEDEKLKPFINNFATLDNFQSQILEKRRHHLDRSLLVKVLKEQNDFLSLSELSKQNIDLLKSDITFSVTTGHQLCMFTGPLYFIYKIISTINLCEQLKEKYPTNNFIPVFWMASEDHDFNEINHFYLYGKRIEWDTKQDGAVGRMNLDGFDSIISNLKSVLGSHKNTDRLINIFEQTYLCHDNLADATRYLINELFGKYGLVIIDGDNKELKQRFIPQIRKDILDNGFKSTIQHSSASLAKNYKSQAFIRDINFFKLSEGKRELINKNITNREIENWPEIFSPNVLLRPLYQEIVLPNIAYVGGGSELSYWMQLKTAFKQEKIPFPVLVLRNSALLINERRRYKFEKLGFKLEDLFLSKDKLSKMYVLTHSNRDISFAKDKEDLKSLYQNLALKISDSSLQNSIRAQVQKQFSYIDSLQDKVIRVEKKRSETAIHQIAKIKKVLFPNDILQERYDNFIQYYLEEGDNFIKRLKDNFDPLSPNFVVLTIKD